jgi:hypothetical protein
MGIFSLSVDRISSANKEFPVPFFEKSMNTPILHRIILAIL